MTPEDADIIAMETKSDHDLLVVLVTKMNTHERMFTRWGEKLDNVCRLADTTSLNLQALIGEHNKIMDSEQAHGNDSPHSGRYTGKQVVAVGGGSVTILTVLYIVARIIAAHYGVEF